MVTLSALSIYVDISAPRTLEGRVYALLEISHKVYCLATNIQPFTFHGSQSELQFNKTTLKTPSWVLIPPRYKVAMKYQCLAVNLSISMFEFI